MRLAKIRLKCGERNSKRCAKKEINFFWVQKEKNFFLIIAVGFYFWVISLLYSKMQKHTYPYI